ncbi:MAG: reverse transcriptase/maturase family protein [Candidatus Pacebacteria bacterium]|nr:reverse transcriptase/maturase family protein [Candidatus Paceibacterota bacterium]MDD5752801.1 reverse transcriptase/maturase family protein [Candidatus Paceibacterota bacterium]
MKRHNNLFPKVVDFKNIHLSYLKTRKRKKYASKALKFSFNLERNLLEIKRELILKTYKHGKYSEFIVYDSKKRTIKAPCFKDRVVHHALCNIIEPIFDKSFVSDSYACRNNKGTHKGIKRLKAFLKNENNCYCLKCDISKYFDNINHNVLISFVKRKIKDKEIIWLIQGIVKSSYKDEEDKGIPIGNLTSQLFANIYLNELDQFIKHVLRKRKFIRYMDDFLILDKEKKQMRILKEVIRLFLSKNLKLKFNPKKVDIFPLFLGIDFLGYILYRDYVLLRKSTVKRLLKKMKKGTINGGGINAWFAYVRHGNAFKLSKTIITGYLLRVILKMFLDCGQRSLTTD